MNKVAAHLSAAPRAVLYGLSIGWIVVLAKCLAAPAVMRHFEVPIHPGWVIVPTLIFAALVTVLVLGHDWEHDLD